MPRQNLCPQQWVLWAAFFGLLFLFCYYKHSVTASLFLHCCLWWTQSSCDLGEARLSEERPKCSSILSTDPGSGCLHVTNIGGSPGWQILEEHFVRDECYAVVHCYQESLQGL